MIRDLREQIKYFVTHKIYMLFLTLAALGGYGYELTHGTLGVDDAAIEVYFGQGLGLAIGRWPFYVLNKVIRIAEYAPWLSDFLAVLILMFAAILWCSLFRYIIKKELPIGCYIVFGMMFMDYSLIAEIFTFTLHNGICTIYCLIALALYMLYYLKTHECSKKEHLCYVFAASIIVSVAVGFYESAAGLFLSGVLLVICADVLSENKLHALKLKNLLALCLWAGILLGIAIIERGIINKVCMYIFHVEPYGYRSIAESLWILEHPGKLFNILLETIRDYGVVASRYYPIKVFLIASVIYIICVGYQAWKRKNATVVLIGVLLYASLFLLSLFQGESLPYRAAQGVSVFVASVLFVVSAWLMERGRIIRIVGMLLIGILIYNSAFDLNRWFVFDYEKNQKELMAIDNIMTDLKKIGYTPYAKSLIFIGEYQFDDWIIDSYSIQNGHDGYWTVRRINDYLGIDPYYRYPFVDTLDNSVLTWAVDGLHEYSGYNSMMHWLFRQYGYEISVGTDEEYEWALQYLEEMPDYPLEGYIREFEDCIIIKL